MQKPRFRLMLAVSLDGFVADRNGGVDWLHDFSPEETSFADFFRGISSIVAGRTTYDQSVSFGSWSFAGKRMVVMTSRPFASTTPDTEIWTGAVEPLADRLAAETTGGDVWVMGGGAVARAFLAAKRLDTLELAVVPVVLGEGIPLFGPGTAPATLRLLGTERFENGIVRLDYGLDKF